MKINWEIDYLYHFTEDAFKRSVDKARKDLEFIPTNMHVERMCVIETDNQGKNFAGPLVLWSSIYLVDEYMFIRCIYFFYSCFLCRTHLWHYYNWSSNCVHAQIQTWWIEKVTFKWWKHKENAARVYFCSFLPVISTSSNDIFLTKKKFW